MTEAQMAQHLDRMKALDFIRRNHERLLDEKAMAAWKEIVDGNAYRTFQEAFDLVTREGVNAKWTGVSLPEFQRLGGEIFTYGLNNFNSDVADLMREHSEALASQ